jgi:hypothetical protein
MQAVTSYLPSLPPIIQQETNKLRTKKLLEYVRLLRTNLRTSAQWNPVSGFRVIIAFKEPFAFKSIDNSYKQAMLRELESAKRADPRLDVANFRISENLRTQICDQFLGLLPLVFARNIHETSPGSNDTYYNLIELRDHVKYEFALIDFVNAVRTDRDQPNPFTDLAYREKNRVVSNVLPAETDLRWYPYEVTKPHDVLPLVEIPYTILWTKSTRYDRDVTKILYELTTPHLVSGFMHGGYYHIHRFADGRKLFEYILNKIKRNWKVWNAASLGKSYRTIPITPSLVSDLYWDNGTQKVISIPDAIVYGRHVRLYDLCGLFAFPAIRDNIDDYNREDILEEYHIRNAEYDFANILPRSHLSPWTKYLLTDHALWGDYHELDIEVVPKYFSDGPVSFEGTVSITSIPRHGTPYLVGEFDKYNYGNMLFDQSDYNVQNSDFYSLKNLSCAVLSANLAVGPADDVPDDFDAFDTMSQFSFIRQKYSRENTDRNVLNELSFGYQDMLNYLSHNHLQQFLVHILSHKWYDNIQTHWRTDQGYTTGIKSERPRVSQPINASTVKVLTALFSCITNSLLIRDWVLAIESVKIVTVVGSQDKDPIPSLLRLACPLWKVYSVGLEGRNDALTGNYLNSPFVMQNDIILSDTSQSSVFEVQEFMLVFNHFLHASKVCAIKVNAVTHQIAQNIVDLLEPNAEYSNKQIFVHRSGHSKIMGSEVYLIVKDKLANAAPTYVSGNTLITYTLRTNGKIYDAPSYESKDYYLPSDAGNMSLSRITPMAIGMSCEDNQTALAKSVPFLTSRCRNVKVGKSYADQELGGFVSLWKTSLFSILQAKYEPNASYDSKIPVSIRLSLQFCDMMHAYSFGVRMAVLEHLTKDKYDQTVLCNTLHDIGHNNCNGSFLYKTTEASDILCYDSTTKKDWVDADMQPINQAIDITFLDDYVDQPLSENDGVIALFVTFAPQNLADPLALIKKLIAGNPKYVIYNYVSKDEPIPFAYTLNTEGMKWTDIDFTAPGFDPVRRSSYVTAPVSASIKVNMDHVYQGCVLEGKAPPASINVFLPILNALIPTRLYVKP